MPSIFSYIWSSSSKYDNSQPSAQTTLEQPMLSQSSSPKSLPGDFEVLSEPETEKDKQDKDYTPPVSHEMTLPLASSAMPSSPVPLATAASPVTPSSLSSLPSIPSDTVFREIMERMAERHQPSTKQQVATTFKKISKKAKNTAGYIARTFCCCYPSRKRDNDLDVFGDPLMRSAMETNMSSDTMTRRRA